MLYNEHAVFYNDSAMSRLITSYILLLVIVMPFPTMAGEIYKCISADGSVTFADTPCTTGDEVQQTVTVDDFDPNLTSQDSNYADGIRQTYSLPDTDREDRYSRATTAEPSYIDIPPMPSSPMHSPPMPTRSSGIATDVTTGRPMIITSPNSAIDPTTGKNVPITLIGTTNNQEYNERRHDYLEQLRKRNIAIEAETQRAKKQRTNANPLLCAEYRLNIVSLGAKINSRPDSRASTEERSQHFYQQKANKEKQSELRRFVMTHCQQ